MKIQIENRDVREEIPVHLFEDYEIESNKIKFKQREEDYEWYNTLCRGLTEELICT
jgi:hypothetical protein